MKVRLLASETLGRENIQRYDEGLEELKAFRARREEIDRELEQKDRKFEELQRNWNEQGRVVTVGAARSKSRRKRQTNKLGEKLEIDRKVLVVDKALLEEEKEELRDKFEFKK